MPPNSNCWKARASWCCTITVCPGTGSCCSGTLRFLGLQYFGFSYTWYFYVTWLPTLAAAGGGGGGESRGLAPLEAAGYAMLPLAAGGFGSIVSGFLPLSGHRASMSRSWASSPPPC